MSQEVRVFDERTNKHVVIHLNEAQLIRAQRDSSFLETIINQHYEDQARTIQEAETQSEDQARAIQETETQSEDQARAIQEETQSSQNIHELDCVPDDSTEGNASKAQFLWSDACIFLLLAIYEENKENLQRQRHKKVYNDIARKMREVNAEYIMTGSQCQSKINSLKKTYKKVKDHNNKSGNDHATWPYFNRMDELFGTTGWANPVAVASESGPAQPPASSSETATAQPKKRRLETLLETIIEEKKRNRTERATERQKNFEKLLEVKEKHHQQKMEVLKNLLSNRHG